MINIPKKHNSIIKIQSLIRGFILRRNIGKLKDGMTFELVDRMIDKYNSKIIFNKNMNKKLSNRKIRNENYPSEITEKLLKFYVYKKTKIMPKW
jgi:hypothetical protein